MSKLILDLFFKLEFSDLEPLKLEEYQFNLDTYHKIVTTFETEKTWLTKIENKPQPLPDSQISNQGSVLKLHKLILSARI